MARNSRSEENHDEFSDDSFNNSTTTSTLQKTSTYTGWKTEKQHATYTNDLEESSDDSLDFQISLLSKKSEKTKKDSHTRLAQYLNQIEKRRAKIRCLKPTFQTKNLEVNRKLERSSKGKVHDTRRNLASNESGELSHHYETLKKQFEHLQKEHESLKVHHETLKNDRDLLQIEHKNLLEENNYLKSESDNSQKGELEEEIRKLRNEKSAAEETKRHLTEAQKRKELELLEIKQQNDEIRRMHNVLKKKYGELTSNLQERNREEESDDGTYSSDDSHRRKQAESRQELLRGLKKEWYLREVEAWKEGQPYISKVNLERKKQQVKLRWKRMNGQERMKALRGISDRC